ncbi:SDR family NAD(P)-dependent oxidoreductase [Thermodesulfobacteriota bacterium]
MELDKNTVIVITGASSGVGEALALALAEKGVQLALAARRDERLEEVAQGVKEKGGDALVVNTDVTIRKQVNNLINKTLDKFGHIDILINNAGKGLMSSLEDLENKDVKEMIALNLYGPLYGIQAVLSHMKRRKKGHIINIGSLGGKVGLPFNAAYSMSKFALIGLHRTLRCEIYGTGVTASIVLPGRIKTPFPEEAIKGDIGMIAQMAAPLIPAKAKEHGLEVPQFPTWVLTAEEVAEKIINIIDKPVSELYTHPGNQDLVKELETDPEAYENRAGAFLLAMQDAYEEFKKGSKI